MNKPASLLNLAGLSKSYATIVLDRVDFGLQRGEVHALVGENGAGKSTLARIVAGLVQPNSGQMQLRELAYAPASKLDGERAGIRMVMQELNLISNLTVAENIFFDQLPHRYGWVNYPCLHEKARQVLELVGLGDVDPAIKVSSLGVGQQQLVEIASGISRRCDVLILDEPTAALTDPEIKRLFRQIKLFTGEGGGVIYISHRMEEIQQIADRITVLRDGKVVATHPIEDVSPEQIVALMVGREMGAGCSKPRKSPGPICFRVQGLRAPPVVQDVSFHVREGEILGFAGLMGSGRTEAMRAIFGADIPLAGTVYLGNSSVPIKIGSPQDAVRQGIALLTEDRKSEGLLLPLSVRANTTLLGLRGLSGPVGWMHRAAERAEASRWIQMLKIRCSSEEQPVNELSGGNQQKVVLAKWLLRDCHVLLCDEPTRGIDVGAKFEIYQLLAQLAEKGKAIVVVSSDLKELLEICDRIAVMSAGRVAAEFKRGEWTQELIMSAALSGYQRKADEQPGD